MKTFTFDKSRSLYERAKKVIPTGIPGVSSPKWLKPADAYPYYSVRGHGARFVDADDNEFVDYICAFGPMILGYQHPRVTAAVIEQVQISTVLTGAPPIVIELAERLIDTVAIADWAFFCKNGADVTALAAVVARKATGRKKIILVNGGYHGTASWMQLKGMPGIVDEDLANVLYVDWNDVEGFRKVLSDHKGDIAAFMAAPYWIPINGDDVLPAEGYWRTVETLCRNEGVVLIVDDVRCGFRLDLRGSNEYFGFKPDLICFSKAIANGHALSALVGTDALKDDISAVNAVGTFWYEASAFAAGIATLKELEKIDAAKTIIAIGEKWARSMRAVAKRNGFELAITGVPSMPSVRIVGDGEDRALTAAWCGECTKRGAYFVSFHNWFLSAAHTDADIALTAEIADDAFRVIQKRQ
jgi:glutamate-1-semialdehyde 2,1-aminomutase